MKKLLTHFLLLFFITSSLPVSAVNEGDTTTLNISGTIVEGNLCTINHGNAIQVNFGDDVFIDQIDGSSYKKTVIPINLDCSEATPGTIQSLTFKANGVGTGCDKYLCTDHDGLMLKLYRDTKELSFGEEANYVTLSDGTAMGMGGGLDFYAVPIKKEGVKIKSGLFLSAATIVVDMK